MELDERPFGGAAIDATGQPFPDATREACLGADAVLLGAVGGPSWNGAAIRPEQGLLALRSVLGCYANLRPARRYTRHTTSPLREDLVAGLDLVIVRELIGGIYFGDRGLGDEAAYDTCNYSASEIRRIVERACALAERRSGRVTSVDKANVLATSKLWRRVAGEVAEGHPGVTLEHQLVDSMAMLLVERPGRLRRDRDREPVRRRALRPRRRRQRRHRPRALGVAGRRRARHLRADPRLGARHRRQRQGQSRRRDPLGRAAARRARAARRRTRDRARRHRRARRRRPHARPGRHARPPTRSPPRSPTHSPFPHPSPS